MDQERSDLHVEKYTKDNSIRGSLMVMDNTFGQMEAITKGILKMD
jgi:hypothetical protein